jgi:hypothetical protein
MLEYEQTPKGKQAKRVQGGKASQRVGLSKGKCSSSRPRKLPEQGFRSRLEGVMKANVKAKAKIPGTKYSEFVRPLKISVKELEEVLEGV